MSFAAMNHRLLVRMQCIASNQAKCSACWMLAGGVRCRNLFIVAAHIICKRVWRAEGDAVPGRTRSSWRGWLRGRRRILRPQLAGRRSLSGPRLPARLAAAGPARIFICIVYIVDAKHLYLGCGRNRKQTGLSRLSKS
mmetsp:Transcript_41227/g.86088  ORF Transcript_41227/g.86088 Transcript_41227/m.86088 type:complete len:138 (-) Transcript_41227:294-707(-)